MTRKDYGVSPEEFVMAWQSSQSIEEVCGKLKMPRGAVHSRAYNYRKAGVNLKPLSRRKQRVDVARLNGLAG